MKKLFAALLLCFAVCAAARAEKVPVTDILGREVSVECPARRVVLTFNFEEYVAATGAEAAVTSAQAMVGSRCARSGYSAASRRSG